MWHVISLWLNACAKSDTFLGHLCQCKTYVDDVKDLCLEFRSVSLHEDMLLYIMLDGCPLVGTELKTPDNPTIQSVVRTLITPHLTKCISRSSPNEVSPELCRKGSCSAVVS